MGKTCLLAVLCAALLIGCSKPPDSVQSGHGSDEPVTGSSTGSPGPNDHAQTTTGTSSGSTTGSQAASEHGQSGDSSGGKSGEEVDSILRTYHLKDLQRVTLKANGHEIKAWVMDDAGKREEGMMWLEQKDVKDDDGMIFVFPNAEKQAFWMKDTVLPLDIMFISTQKKVLNVQKGQPFDRTSLPSSGPAQYVLEMKQGSAERLGIKAGTPITIPSSVVGK